MERAAGTFQASAGYGELRLAGASSIRDLLNGVLEQFLPRYNQRFRVSPRNALSPQYRRSWAPDLSLEQVLCFKHRQEGG